MRKHVKKVLITSLIMSLSISSLAYAAEWKQDNVGWWWQEDDGSYPTNSWKEISGKWYYFGADGYMLSNTTTPDGYQVGADGAWVTTNISNQFQLKSQVRHCMDAHSLDELLAGLTNATAEWRGGMAGDEYVEECAVIKADGLPTSVEWVVRHGSKENPLGASYVNVIDETAPKSYGLNIWTYHMTEVFDGLTESSYTVNEMENMLRSIGAKNIQSYSEKLNGSVAGMAVDGYYSETKFNLDNYECSIRSYPGNGAGNSAVYVPYNTHAYIKTKFDK